MMRSMICKIEDCEEKARAKNLCKFHYRRVYRGVQLNKPRRAYILRQGGTVKYKVGPEYTAWAGMRQRCINKNSKAYHNYGGRGIKVCERWESYTNFYTDMGKKPSKDHSLDRINNEGNYEPSNCRWATRDQQAINRRTTTRLDIPKSERIKQLIDSGLDEKTIEYAMNIKIKK